MYIRQDPQSQLADMPFADYAFNPDHPLMKLAEAIAWDELLDRLASFYAKEQGRPSIFLRAQAGTLMIKFLKNLSDRDTVRCVQENIYAQSFCGLLPAQAVDYMNVNTGLTNFRAKIGPEGMALIEDALTRAALGRSKKKGGSLILDMTCIPSDIHYPTDIKLLERCRREIIRLMKEAKGFGLEVLYRTYNRIARKIFVSFSKKGRPRKKVRKRVHKQMLQFVGRNLKQLMDLRAKATRALGMQCRNSPEVRGFLQALKAAENKIRLIMHQQNQVRKGVISIPNRIVSFHKDHVRPISRGKFPLATEFGSKPLVAIVKGCVYIIRNFQNNVADATLVTASLRWFADKFGCLPKKVIADRGFYARWRVRCLKAMGIISGLQPRGKVKKISSAQRRMNCTRQAIEAKISLGKRKFGWGRCLAKNTLHEDSWVSLGAGAMNAHCAFIAQPP